MGLGISKQQNACTNSPSTERRCSCSQQNSDINARQENSEESRHYQQHHSATHTRDNNYATIQSGIQSADSLTPVSTDASKFYYYPKSNVQTAFVHSSQFPYTKPKIVPVRPRQAENPTKSEASTTEAHTTFKAERFYGMPKPPTTANFVLRNKPRPSDVFSSGSGPSSCRPVNDRQWSVPNVMATKHDSMRDNYVLPHRKILELRRTVSPAQPYGRHYEYACDLEPTYSVDVFTRRRPPTPVPDAWFPAERSSDYLVASSLLAMEQESERRARENQDISFYGD